MEKKSIFPLHALFLLYDVAFISLLAGGRRDGTKVVQEAKAEHMALMAQLVLKLHNFDLWERALIELSKVLDVRPCPLLISVSLEERIGFPKSSCILPPPPQKKSPITNGFMSVH